MCLIYQVQKKQGMKTSMEMQNKKEMQMEGKRG
jgi:hypothetical protein